MTTYTPLQEQAVRLIGHAHLLETRLFGITARHETFATGDGDVELGDLKVRLEATVTQTSGLAYVLIVQTDVVEAAEDEDAAPLKLAEIEVGYGALYTLDEATGAVTEEETKAFGLTIAAMTVWPYIRALLSNTVREMNLGAGALLPTITQRELAEAVASFVDVEPDVTAEPASPKPRSRSTKTTGA